MDKLDELRKISENSHNDKENQRYVLRYVVTAEILNIMEKNDIRKATLAKQLGYSKGHISRVLSGDRNMTLDTISDIAMALGVNIEFTLKEKKATQKHTEQDAFFWLISNDKREYNRQECGDDFVYGNPKIVPWVA